MRSLVRLLDSVIRRSSRVFEFSSDPECLLRLQFASASRTLRLSDTTLRAGDMVLLLHLWNERLPPVPPGGADLAWALNTLRRFKSSLFLAADFLQSDPRAAPVRGVGGVTILLDAGLHGAGRQFVQRLGFQVFPYSNPLGRFGEFWENFYSWIIIWTFNPRSLPRQSLLSLRRSEIWISREAFLGRFGSPRMSETALNDEDAPREASSGREVVSSLSG